MTSSRLELPAGQNWSCHGCTDCCRNQRLVTLSEAEQEQIERQGWTLADGVDPSRMIVPGRNHSRLGHQADGACMFLDASGRCRIHAKFGEAAKPLACRLYPFLIHPAGKKVFVGLRFSCPSAAANRGRGLADHATEVARLVPDVLPAGCEVLPPPAVAATPGLDWTDFLRFVRWLEVSLREEKVPVALKLLRALRWLESAERGYLDQIEGESADEILEALVRRSREKVPALPSPAQSPSRFGRLFLRLLVLEHARRPTVGDQQVRSAHRWKMLEDAFRFVVASARTPAVREEFKRVEFAEIERPFGPLPAAAEALLDRYFQVKVQSLQFCGKGFHDCSLIEGFRNLALMYPVILCLSRWLAAGDGRAGLSEADVLKAVSIADHQYGVAPYVAWRTRLLHQRDDITRLCAWYGGTAAGQTPPSDMAAIL
ncbi:MAG: YkgJ family cysteine cluster protein [Verrucomicrobiota bacterium]|jgi:lysine-N-methylase